MALREHLSCLHRLTIEVSDGPVVLTHDGGTRHLNIGGEGTARGSAIFHELARAILGDSPHHVTQLSISDEEYAGFTHG